VNNIKNKKIGILCGGWSSEREISLLSGKNVYECLLKNNFDTFFLDLDKDDEKTLNNFINLNSIDIIFNLIHGKGGEDGLIQSYLDKINIKYVGSDAESSKISFDKISTKEIWSLDNLSTPSFILLNKPYSKIRNHVGLPFVVKPVKGGSSVEIKIIKSETEYNEYIKNIKNLNNYFAEKLVTGEEYTAPIIGEDVFPIIKINTKREFYDYNAKYIDEDTVFTFPEFDKNLLTSINKLMKKAFFSLGCKGWGRVDFFIDENKIIQLIEVNSIPGMTSHSLVPMSAEKNELKLIKLLEIILSHS